MKKYVITLSQVFPVTHCRNGEPTGFKGKFLTAIGKAEFCIRQWSGKPYRSKQVEIAVLTKEDGIGIQRMTVAGCATIHPIFVDTHSVSAETLARNDGLSLPDWRNWFSRYDLTEPLAVIQFTKFRY